MSIVFKYPLQMGDSVVEMPAGSVPLAVQVQYDQRQVWVKVPSGATTHVVPYAFRVVGTGHERDDLDDFTYLGTFQLHDLGFVGHVFFKYPA